MSVHADDNQAIARDAFTWLIGAGAFAVALSVFLALADYGMSRSDGEQRLGNTLREIRTAQASLPARVTDERQTEDAVYASHSGVEQSPSHD